VAALMAMEILMPARVARNAKKAGIRQWRR